MSNTVEQIKERLTIVDVVGAYVKLTRAGRYFKGLSPFTKEKTPSFFVTPDKGLYHCFSTGKGGDMFTFVEEMERVDFKGALKILADKAGIELTPERPGERDEREETFAALEAATKLFEAALPLHPDAEAYLKNRGISEKTRTHFRIGYAHKEWRALSDALYAQGFSEVALLRAGLIKHPDSTESTVQSSERKSYDRFRGRIMFPLKDVSGRVIAFSGRIFEDDTKNPQAKYLNSPEGPLFDKSRALYGLDVAKTSVRTLGFSMLVEGQVDLILAHQLGYTNAVATSGTALTESHVEILKRMSDNVLISYDGDKAGIHATYRAAELLLPKSMQVKAVVLPEGKDPADIIQSDPEAYKQAVRSAVPVVDFFIAHAVRTTTDERMRKIEVGRTVLPLVGKIGNALEATHYVSAVSRAIGAPESAVQAELDKVRTQRTSDHGTLPDPFFSEDARLTLLLGLYATFSDLSDVRAERIATLIRREYGEEALTAFSVKSDAERESAKIIASEEFFMLNQGVEAETEALAVLESESRSTRTTEVELRKLRDELRAAEVGKQEADIPRILAEIARLSKESN